MSRTTRHAAELALHALEAREVPATAVLSGGVLSITGDDTSETIVVRQTTTAITVDGISGSHAPASVTEIRVDARGGNDLVSLQQSGAVVKKPAVVWGGDGKDSINGGNGNDYLDGGAGNDVIFGFKGKDKIAGDAGDDALFGGAGNDQMAGGDGEDLLQGDGGKDHLDGGRHDDSFIVGPGDHVYDDVFGTTVVGSGHVHHHVLGFADRSEFGWFDEHMTGDADLRRLARAADRNDSISRAEMIGILDAAADGTTVTGGEFGDLKKLTAEPTVGMSAAVRNLSKKVVHGDPANAFFTGGDGTREALGNLTAGSPDDRLERLVDKWFRGLDRPMAKNVGRTQTFGYQEAAGGLFVGGPSVRDLNQGNVGDCYFLAALGGVALKDPQKVRDMFTDNGDGTFTVRFFRDGLFDAGQAEYVTVDRHLPVTPAGNLVFANAGQAAAAATNELWVALAEKAYAQVNESGWIGQDGTNSYNGVGGPVDPDDNTGGINGGFPDAAMRHVANSATTVGLVATAGFADLRAAFDAGRAVVLGTKSAPPHADVVGGHAYVMTGYDAAAQTVTLRNPHGANGSKPVVLTLSMTQLRASFNAYWTGDQ